MRRANAPSSISKKPASNTTTPAAKRCPVAISPAALRATKKPNQVITLGVIIGALVKSAATGRVR